MVDGSNLAVAAFAAAVLAVLWPPSWRFVRYPVTAVHEFGHVAVSVLMGGKAPRVRLWRDTSGLTMWRTQQSSRGRSVLIALAGHVMPPLTGASCATAVAAGDPRWALIGLTILVGLITIAVRNVWGVVVCAALGAVCYAGFRYGAVATEIVIAAAAGVLCAGGLRALREELSSNRRGGASDTQVAARATRMPALAWGVALLMWALACTGWSIWQIGSVANPSVW